jgi:4-amino-4-deoxy-L-arabinose transferase-like glycosyltransferase
MRATVAAHLPRPLLLALVGGCFVLLWGLPTVVIPLATDQVQFALGARTILDGGQLYGDLWDIKPPLIYLLYAVPFALAGEHMEAVRVFDLVSTAVAMGAVFLLARRFFGEQAAVFAGGFYAFTYLTWAGADGLAEAEAFLAAPLALAFFLYRPEQRRRGVDPGALASGVALGAAFAIKTSALLFVVGLPVAELALRRHESWSGRDALLRLTAAAFGFFLVQGALVAYLAAGGVLDDFVDIQRRYTAPYMAYRWSPLDVSHPRFLIEVTGDWIRSTSFLVVPALAALLFGLRERERAGAVYLLAAVAGLGLLTIWWQGKMFRYHWLVMFPLLAPLAGYALDRTLRLFAPLGRRVLWAAALVSLGGLALLAFEPLLETYDNYRSFVSFADGSLSRRQVEARYQPLLARNHQLVDYVREHGDPDDRLYVWGFWPVAHFWAERPLVSRFVINSGLRATWAPESWREELMEDLMSHPPRFFAVARGDNQPWLVGTGETSDAHLRDRFPELRRFLDERYVLVLDIDLFALYDLTAEQAADDTR